MKDEEMKAAVLHWLSTENWLKYPKGWRRVQKAYNSAFLDGQSYRTAYVLMVAAVLKGAEL